MTLLLSLLAPVLLAVALNAAPPGAAIYAANCATCHGAQGWGSPDGPNLHGAGMAKLDFYLRTGRMPASVPWVEVAHRDERAGQQLPLNDVRALEAYLAPVVAGGPALPEVTVGSDLERGRRLYESNCEQCHAIRGDGGSIGRADWAPALHAASIDEVADAVRAGPGEMPRFGEQQLTQSDLDNVAGFVLALEPLQPGTTPLPSASTGPVPEGALGYVAVLLVIIFAAVLWRHDRGKGSAPK